MRRAVLALLVAAGALVTRGETLADDAGAAAAAGDDTRRSEVVVELGSARKVTVGELEDRIGSLPPFQRATFGADPAKVRRAFLEQVLLPESLEALGAQAQKLDQQPSTAQAIERARSKATVRAVRARIGPESAISMDDVQKYYDANRSRYDTPERIQIWRILCKTKEEAQSVLDQAKKEPTPKEFGELAREHSVDKATNLRAGNLGFITPEGTSNEPGLKVDPSIVKAASGVRDGDLVPAPVPEGEYFSVVWRRGGIPATRHTVDQVAAQIRDALWKTRVKDETDRLVASLREAKLRDLNVSLLDQLGAPSTGDAGVRDAR